MHSTYYINDVLILPKNTSERIWTKSVPSPSITGVHYYIYLDIECRFILHVIAVHHGIECLFAFISALLVGSLWGMLFFQCSWVLLQYSTEMTIHPFGIEYSLYKRMHLTKDTELFLTSSRKLTRSLSRRKNPDLRCFRAHMLVRNLLLWIKREI